MGRPEEDHRRKIEDGTNAASGRIERSDMNLITPEQTEIQQAAKHFTAQHIIPKAAEYDKSGKFHAFLLEEAKSSKIFGMAIPKSFGGLEYSPLTQMLVLEEWGYGCCGMATTLAASILSMESVMLAGTDAQKKQFYTPMLNGKIGAFCLTEPTAGSDVGGGKTTAVKTGDFYTIHGSKCWITNGGIAEVFIIFAQTDPKAGVKGISAFILERGTPGFTVGQEEDKLGLRSSNTVFLGLHDVKIPASALLGKEGEGMKIAMQTLDLARPAIGALAVGLAQRALDLCVAHMHERFPAKPFPGQALQFKLADMRIQIEAARQVLHHMIALREAGKPFSEESAMAKTYGTDVAMNVATSAMRLMGSAGYISEVGKLMRDAKVMQIYEGTNQIQRLVVARAVLARPKAPAPAEKAMAK
jgi:alkylation response protein AidB-like acyl-CoA dehydrogenase